MSNIRAIQQQILDSESIKLVTASLGQVAALRLKATKGEIQHNSEFFNEITEVYRAVEAIATTSGLSQKLLSQKNGQVVSVLLTSNAHFYGGLDRELADFFRVNTQKYSSQKVVVGQSGIKYLEEVKFPFFTKITFKQDLPTASELKALVDSLRNYSKIFVYYSKFVTLLDQKPEVVDLSPAPPSDVRHPISDIRPLGYILEPELSLMIRFFEFQILSGLLNSIFLGANLARIAARMVAMDSAEQNSQKEIDKEKMELLKAQKYLKNIQILENFVSISINI